MTLPRGSSSGRGRAHLSKANPPKPGAGTPPVKGRKPLAPVARRKVEEGRAPETKPRKPLAQRSPARVAREAGADRPAPLLAQGRSKRVRPGGADAGAEWRLQAFERVIAEHGRLVDEVTGENLSAADAQVHHMLEAGDQWTRGVAEDRLLAADGAEHVLVWHPDLTCVVHRRTHERHHSRVQPIPRGAVRSATWDLAAELDHRAGDGWWVARLESDYPESTTWP